ncbi:MAG: copper amine oxidase N-terminal domain-containing protein [Anaerovorax sp.]
MKSKIISVILALTLVLSTTSIAMATTTSPTKSVKIFVNGTAVQYNNQTGYPFKDANNRTQVPFRQTLEAFGAEVDWNQQTQTATAKKGNIIVKVPIGVNFILKDDKQIVNDTVAVVQNGKTYLPIRVVFESFGLPVNWNEAEQSVIIGSAIGAVTAENVAKVKKDLLTMFTAHSKIANYGESTAVYYEYNGKMNHEEFEHYFKQYDKDVILAAATEFMMEYGTGLTIENRSIKFAISYGESASCDLVFVRCRNGGFDTAIGYAFR